MDMSQCDIFKDLLSRRYVTNQPGKILKTFLPNPMWLHLPENTAKIEWSI